MRLPLALIALTSVAPLAHASYYVIDNPPPPPVSALIRSMPQFQSTQSDSKSVNVPFARRSSQLSRDALRALSGMLDSAQDASRISIEGCGDSGDSESVAYRRAANVKAWLLDNGISSNVVTTSADGAVTKTPRGFNCVVRLAVGMQPSRMPTYVQGAQAEPEYRLAAPTAPAAIPAPAQAFAPNPRNEQMRMIERVLDMANAKIITSENAVAMIQQLMKDTAPRAASPTPVAAIAPAPIVAQIMPLQQQVYALTANRTLRDTLGDWARSAGWKEPLWAASNPYLVAQGQSLSSDFMGALRTVSDLVPGLDFRVNAATREITVMDAAR
ncbi:TcpQ domain-containing protein [Burkholderia cenocepacia]|uniref:TcpQ domain-containing protein n=1 Tax=Burkholderia cenocepacia TaxID=95486 RepID=UPI0013E08A53|nr:TcpQ domain-containing protein [Burkholderia cenocepacia]MCW3587381.1 TcpQ domain-containing protein [Burkholderia cenocepacia]MCW3632585.1 TcpQ domain-containing protein [Burkholderia cenocepacia]MCW5181816.1 TcpQ domain-containing protein [Burkholderia cenocepacia]